jgi:copper chaperone CopZ
MKNFVIILAGCLAMLTAMPSFAQKTGDKVVCFKSNMHCQDCANTLFEQLRFEKGVKDLKIDHVSNTVKVVYAEKKTDDGKLQKAVEKKGYKAEKISEADYSVMLKSAGEKPVSNQGGNGHH